MSSRMAIAIAAAFATGVFVTAAPSALGHGPEFDRDRGSMHGEIRADHMADACEPDAMSEYGDEHETTLEEMLEHMSGTDGHMSGAGWMTDMMSGAGGMR